MRLTENTEVICSNLSLGSPKRLILQSPDAFVSDVKSAHLDGLSWHPLRYQDLLIELHKGASPEFFDMVRCSEQSFASRPAQRYGTDPESLTSHLVRVVMPFAEESLSHLLLLEIASGKELPVTLYPSLVPKRFLPKFKERLFQPTIVEMDYFGAHDYVELIDKSLVTDRKDEGFTGFAIDLKHIRRAGTNSLANWKDTLPGLLTYTPEIHVGLGRTDVGHRNYSMETDDRTELKDFLLGKECELARMLMLVRDNAGVDRAKIEALPGEVVRACNEIGLCTLTRRYLKGQGVLLEGLDRSGDMIRKWLGLPHNVPSFQRTAV